MNHETLQALYALDVAEVGEEEAATRWEYFNGSTWRVNATRDGNLLEPKWCKGIEYRRKPGIPWPKALFETTIKPSWPVDAPEWANQIVTLYSDGTFIRVGKYETISLIERPNPAIKKIKKIDWSKLRPTMRWRTFKDDDGQIATDWIAWNCDENTRGNPLPDGLVIEWYGASNCNMASPPNMPPPWSVITRFRIAGIQEGWE